MTTETNRSRDQNHSAGLHLIAGPGACRSIIGTLGPLLALRWFNMGRLSTVGGISGGSIPLSFFADGLSIRQIIELAMNLEFKSLLDQDDKLTAVMLEHNWNSRQRGALPQRGKYKMERFHAWLETTFGGRWPSTIPYWTMATDKNGAQILFNKEGTFRREQGSTFEQISNITPSLGTSLCATSTVPGFFVPLKLALESGEVVTLYDGALSWESTRPITLVEEFYSAAPGDIIMFDVGPELNTYDRLVSYAWGFLCGGRCVPPRGLRSINQNNVTLVLPAVTKLRSFDFAAHPDLKWTAIMECFAATVFALNNSYRLTEDQFLEAKDVLAEFHGIYREWHKLPPGQLRERTEALLTARGILSD